MAHLLYRALAYHELAAPFSFSLKNFASDLPRASCHEEYGTSWALLLASAAASSSLWQMNYE